MIFKNRRLDLDAISLLDSIPSPSFDSSNFKKTNAFFAIPDSSDQQTPRPPDITVNLDLSPPSPPLLLTPIDLVAEVVSEVAFSDYASSASSDNGLDSIPDLDLDLAPGNIIRSPQHDQALRLTKPLGRGSFSAVWLAQDLSPTPLLLKSKRSLRDLRRKEGTLKPSRSSSSLMKRLRSGVSGTRPGGGTGSGFVTPTTPRYLTVDVPDDSPSPSTSPPSEGSLSRASSVSWKSTNSDTHTAPTQLKRTPSSAKRLVAVKLTSRGVIESSDRERDRTRVSFVREVEILKHISHPNITPLLSHLTTLSHHVLVLPYLAGGDLLVLVNGPAWNSLTESLLQRIFGELCKAVGWMHSVGLVHRDIKLENILLTAPLPSTPPASTLIQLTDFGLSRFIDTDNPLLTTRCGSEAYAAPELVVGGAGYDPRETDAWACGVVLYELVGRTLPFGEGPGESAEPSERRQWLVRIAKGEWAWPTHGLQPAQGTAELCGVRLVESVGAKRVVKRLLVRDTSRRACVADLWDDPWVDDDDAVVVAGLSSLSTADSEPLVNDIVLPGDPVGDEEYEDDTSQEGLILDRASMHDIASQEVV